MTRPAPAYAYKGVELHKAADAGNLLWIGGPAPAYTEAAAFLQYNSAQLRRIASYRDAYPNVQARRPEGVAFLFGPSSLLNQGAVPGDFLSLQALLSSRRWHVFRAREFLEVIEGRRMAGGGA
jgi:hypothetical protein